MKTAQDLTAAIPLAHPAVQEKAAVKTRLVYIDNLRVLMTVLVIMVHAAVTYGGAGGWFTTDPNPEPLASAVLTLFNGYCQAFFMGLFFFLSGYFVPGSIDRKGQAWFWKDRLLRLGLPLLIFSLLLAKIPLYLDQTYHGLNRLNIWEFSVQNFVVTFDSGPTWFLFALLVLSAGYCIWRVFSARLRPVRIPQPSEGALFGFALVMGVLLLLTCQVSRFGLFIKMLGFVYLQPAFFAQYIMMFAAGILAYRGNWLPTLVAAGQRIWKWIALACVVALPAGFVLGGGANGNLDAYFSGFAWQAIFLLVWVGFTCVSFSLALMGLFARRANMPSRLQSFISANTYAAFILHPLALVPLTIAMNGLALPGLVKFVIAVVGASCGAYLMGAVLRLVPGMKRVL